MTGREHVFRFLSLLWVSVVWISPVDALVAEARSLQDTPCSDGASVTRDQCFAKQGAKCMLVELEMGQNLCLPCEWAGIPIPCVPAGAMYPQGKVKRCDMSCSHQQLLTKASPCVDTSGDISADSCFAKGSTVGSKCMWTSFVTSDGAPKSACGPCFVAGVGVVPPYNPGNTGPEARSTVLESMSQCGGNGTDSQTPCDGNPSCPEAGKIPRLVTPAPIEALGMQPKEGAPAYVAVVVPEPYGAAEYTEASAAAALAAGWAPGSVLPPDAELESPGPPPWEGPAAPPDVNLVYGAPPPPGIPWHPGLWPTFAPPLGFSTPIGSAQLGTPTAAIFPSLTQLRGNRKAKL